MTVKTSSRDLIVPNSSALPSPAESNSLVKCPPGWPLEKSQVITAAPRDRQLCVSLLGLPGISSWPILPWPHMASAFSLLLAVQHLGLSRQLQPTDPLLPWTRGSSLCSHTSKVRTGCIVATHLLEGDSQSRRGGSEQASWQ